MIKAVIFDMDGVLFDTERLVSVAWRQIAKENSMKEIDRVLKECIGRSYEDARLVFYEHYGEAFDYDGFRAKARQLFFKDIEDNGLPIKKGVDELLAYLKQGGYKIGLASSTRKEGVLSHLKVANIEAYFEVIVGGDMVKHSKPNPEIYQMACKLLEVEPDEAICIEDSLNGILSASSAGLNVIMVPDLIGPTEEILPLLHKQFKSLLEVKAYLESIKE